MYVCVHDYGNDYFLQSLNIFQKDNNWRNFFVGVFRYAFKCKYQWKCSKDAENLQGSGKRKRISI